MTAWLDLERLERNNLPLPAYQTELSAGVDFAACLSRVCKLVVSEQSTDTRHNFIINNKPTTLSNAYTRAYSNQDTRNYIIDEMPYLITDKTDPNNSFILNAENDPTYHQAIKASQALNQKMSEHISITNLIYKDISQNDNLELCIYPQETIMVPLGFRASFSKSYVLHLHPRASIGLRGLMIANGTDIINPDYRGELFAALWNRTNHNIIIRHGERIVQGVLLQFTMGIVRETKVDETQRGCGCFGSTGL